MAVASPWSAGARWRLAVVREVAVIEAPGMLLIGGTGRGVGKTRLAEQVLQRFGFAELGAVKVTVVDDDGRTGTDRSASGSGYRQFDGPFVLERIGRQDAGGDSGRLLAAGAEPVWWLRVRRAALAAGAAALLAELGSSRPVVCESSALRQVLRPDLLLLVCGAAGGPWKPSALDARSHADRLVRWRGNALDMALEELQLENGRWRMPAAAAAIVLAGGASRRMGRDKSLLDVDGQPLIAHVIAQLDPWLAPVLISANAPDKYAFLQRPVIPDAVTGQGPARGIASALAASPRGRNLVVACDIPRIDRALGRSLVQALEGADVAVPVDPQGHLEPLFAAYRRRAAPALRTLLDAGGRRIADAYAGLRVRRLVPEPNRRLVNLNTRADWIDFFDRGSPGNS